VSGEGAGPPPSAVAQVVVDLPVARTFSYAVPAPLAGLVGPGQRVRVRFRGRPRAGIVVALADTPLPGSIEPLEAVIDPVPALSPALIELGRIAARETASAWGQTLWRALPPAARVPAPAAIPADPPPGDPGQVAVACGALRDGVAEAWAARSRESGRGLLVLAPEIETARRWAARIEQCDGTAPALVTSAERPRRRWEAWWALRRGERRAAVGTRAAAFAPVRSLGALIVIDEHDPGHKAPDVPRVNVRDLALERARLEGADCLLVSGAPSLESWVRAREGRAAWTDEWDGQWPAVRRVDLRPAGDSAGLAPELRDAVRQAAGAGQPVLLFLNRIGYGRALSCLECGAVGRCARCRVALVYHRGARTLGCRLCGTRKPAVSLCGRCRGRRLAPAGWGTERLEAEVRKLVPGVPVARYDSEVDPARAALVREAYRAGRIPVLVGTQMALRLARERPVQVAALVLADVTLGVPDFRAGERLYQQAWHLAETVAPGGSVWLQSLYPEHLALEAVARRARDVFYEREWAERQALRYPPAGRMARLVVAGPGSARQAGELAESCRREGLTVLGPVTLAGGRSQVVLLGGEELPQAVASALEPLRGRRRLGARTLTVDVDPVEL
jgi:primosomal protein N' (replication factor Y)